MHGLTFLLLAALIVFGFYVAAGIGQTVLGLVLVGVAAVLLHRNIGAETADFRWRRKCISGMWLYMTPPCPIMKR